MRKERLIGKERYAGYLLIFMQGLILALLAVFFLNRQYMDVWRTYPQGSEVLTVYLKNVAAEKERDTQNFLLTSAEEQGLFVARTDGILDDRGSSQGYQFGVYGNAENRQAELSFLKESILTCADLKELLASDRSDSTLGVEMGSINSIGEIPSRRPAFSPKRNPALPASGCYAGGRKKTDLPMAPGTGYQKPA